MHLNLVPIDLDFSPARLRYARGFIRIELIMHSCSCFAGMKPKRGWYVLWLFFKIGLCSAISFKRSRRELSTDVAEHGSMLKNDRNTLYPVLVSYPKHKV